jgi:hypothetical protein
MALITVNMPLQFGYEYANNLTATGTTVNSTATGYAYPFIPEITGSITHIALPINSVTTAVTNLDVGIMASNAAGNLPINIYSATPNTLSIAVQGSSLTEITLTNPVSVTRGTVYWLAVRPNASFTGNISLLTAQRAGQTASNNFPGATRLASNWVRSGNTSNVIYKVGTTWYADDMAVTPVGTTFTPSVSTEYGSAIIFPANHPAVKLKSITICNPLNNNATTGNPGMITSCKIYNASGTLLYTFDSEDTDRIGNNAVVLSQMFWNSTGADIWLEPNTKYYIMNAMSGTFTNTPTWYTTPTNPAYQHINGSMSQWYATNTAGTFTENTSMLYPTSINTSAIRFDNSGGAGGYYDSSPMFNGGFH